MATHHLYLTQRRPGPAEGGRDAPRQRVPTAKPTNRVSIDSIVRSLASRSRSPSPANGAERTQAQHSIARGYGVPITYHQQRRQRRAPVQPKTAPPRAVARATTAPFVQQPSSSVFLSQPTSEQCFQHNKPAKRTGRTSPSSLGCCHDQECKTTAASTQHHIHGVWNGGFSLEFHRILVPSFSSHHQLIRTEDSMKNFPYIGRARRTAVPLGEGK
jgi:hypothetical protein